MTNTPDFTQYSAAIFDLDGTLVHSEHVWERSKIEVLGTYGLSPTRELLISHYGRGLKGFLEEAFEGKITPEMREHISNEIGAKADELLPEMRAPVAGAADLLRSLHEMNLKIAICSSSPRRHIISAMDMLEISEKVSLIVSGADLPRGKPDPLPYLTTIEQLGIEAADAVVFEDSPSGAHSALAAGLPVIAVGEGCTRETFPKCLFHSEDFSALSFF